MNLLFLLNGHKDKILKAHGFDESDFHIVKLDEKLLVNPKAILKAIKSKPFERLYYGCIELELQRFHVFMKIYILFSFIFKGGIIDEKGNANKFSAIKLIFIEIPFLLFEAIASIFVVFYYYMKLPVKKCIYLKNH